MRSRKGETMITNHPQRDAEEYVGYALSVSFTPAELDSVLTTVF